MKASYPLESAIEKSVITLALFSTLFLAYPESTVLAQGLQTQNGNTAQVFDINSKPTTNQNVTQSSSTEVNPTLINPCYPGPVGSCNPNGTITAQAASVEIVPGKQYSKEEVQQLIVHYSGVYGINPEAPLCIARLESGFNQFSKNRRSTASGVFQYLTSTWRHTDEGKAGLGIFDANANVKAAVKYMAIHKNTQPWVVRSKCPPLKFVK